MLNKILNKVFVYIYVDLKMLSTTSTLKQSMFYLLYT